MRKPALKAFNDWARAEAERIKSGPLGPILDHSASPHAIVACVEEFARSVGGQAGTRGRTLLYAVAKERALADWDALPKATRSKRGSHKVFAHSNAESYGVEPKTILTWIQGRD